MSLNVCAFRDGKAVASVSLQKNNGRHETVIVNYSEYIFNNFKNKLNYLESNNGIRSYIFDKDSCDDSDWNLSVQFVSELETLKHIAEIENLSLVIN